MQPTFHSESREGHETLVEGYDVVSAEVVLQAARLDVDYLLGRNVPRLDQGEEAAIVAQANRANELGGRDQFHEMVRCSLVFPVSPGDEVLDLPLGNDEAVETVDACSLSNR